MRGINNRKKGTALLAVIAFVILTAIIAEAFLIYFYNQYRLTLQKILYEKTFYFALSGIEWAKVSIHADDGRLSNPGDKVIFNDWGNVPELNLRFFPLSTEEFPDLPYTFQLVIKRQSGNGIISFCESEINLWGGIKLYASRRLEVTFSIDGENKLVETSWTEKIPPGTSADL